MILRVKQTDSAVVTYPDVWRTEGLRLTPDARGTMLQRHSFCLAVLGWEPSADLGSHRALLQSDKALSKVEVIKVRSSRPTKHSLVHSKVLPMTSKNQTQLGDRD